MIYMSRFCCICLKQRQKLVKLSIGQENNLSCRDKLLMLIPQLVIDEIKEIVHACEECRISIDNMYDFRETCLSNNVLLWKYIRKLRSDKDSEFLDSLVLNKLNETQICEGDGENVCFEKIDIKTEFKSIDDRLASTNELNDERQLIDDDPLRVDIKRENQTPDDFHENNSMVNSIKNTVYDSIKVKEEDILSLNTELDIERIKIETSNNPINIEDDIHLQNTSENVDARRGDVGSEKNESHKTSENIEDVNDSRDINSSYLSIKKNENDEICNESYVSTHLEETHIDLKSYECETCNKTFKRKYDLKRHKIVHTADKSYKCEICVETFSKLSLLNVHNRIHNVDKSYKCEICDKVFSKISCLKVHNRIHTGEKPYMCKFCNKSFCTSCSLIRHIRVHTGEKPYKCEICNNSFKELSHLNVHNRIHTGEKRFKCDICNKSFSISSSLVKHIRIHTGEKPYECKTCNRLFTNSSHMYEHSRIHTGEKPHKCKICGKSYTTSSQLKSHFRCHTGEKPYKCQTCNKSFSHSKYLYVHKRSHTGEKPYKCEICNKSFSQCSHLSVHRKIHTRTVKP